MSASEHRKLRHARVKEILFEASRLGPEARSDFLERACIGDVELRREVESLLSYLEGRAVEEWKAAGDRRQSGAASASESEPARTGVTLLSPTPKDGARLDGQRKRSR